MSDDLIDGRGLFGARRRRREAQRLAEAGTPQAARTLVRVLLQGADGQLAEIAERGLRGLTDQAAIDALCEAPLTYGDPRLTALIDEAGHRHSDPARRATLLFLAGDFDAYAELDFDGTMLAAVRAVADGPLRARLAARARESGRIEWVRAIAPARPGPGTADVSEAEWDAAIGILIATGRLDELWRLVQHAPPVWGARILRELGRRGWRPPDGPDAAGFDELTTLTDACSDELSAGLLSPEPTCRLGGSGHGSVSLTFTADGSMLVVGNAGGDLRTYRMDEEPGTGFSAIRSDISGINDVLAVPATDLVALAGTTEWEIRRAERQHLTRLQTGVPGLPEGAVDLAATPDGRFLVGAGGEGLLVWRPPWREPELLPSPERLHRIAVSPVGGGLAATLGRRRPAVRLWNLSAGEPAGLLTGHKGAVHCLATTPDGELLASGGRDGTIRLWRLPSGEPAGVIEAERSSVMDLAVTPDGKLLVSAGGEGAVRLWQLPSGAPAGVLTGHKDKSWVSRVAVRPDGTLLASGGSDMTVRLWRLPSGEPAGTLTGHTGLGIITDLAFSPDGTRLATGAHRNISSEGSAALLWRLTHPAVWAATRTPAGALGTDTYDLPEAVTDDRERAWARLVAGLVRWRRRHDVELGDAAPGAPGGSDIEIDRGTSGRLRS